MKREKMLLFLSRSSRRLAKSCYTPACKPLCGLSPTTTTATTTTTTALTHDTGWLAAKC